MQQLSPLPSAAPFAANNHHIDTTEVYQMRRTILAKAGTDCISPVRYQSPLPPDQVKPLVEFDYEGDNSAGVRGRGRGGRGRGRGRGIANIANDYEDVAWDNRGRGYGRGGWGRGRGRSFRGRGRGGYGGPGYYQQEAGGYDDEAPVPAQGRGRGRGRGRNRGRGRDFGSNRQTQGGGA